MPGRFRYSRWDGTQAGFDLDADEVLAQVTDDLVYHGDPNAALRRLLQEGRPLTDAEGAQPITNEDLLRLDVDVLVPAALGNVIRGDNADEVRARIVAEGANHPTSPEGDKVLADKGVRILPDVLVNGGGVTGSYFEWTQNIQQFRWEEERVNEELRKTMSRAWKNVHGRATVDGIPLRLAAFAIAVEKVDEADRLRGYI